MGRELYKTLSVPSNQTSQVVSNVIIGVLNHVVHVTSTLLVTFLATTDHLWQPWITVTGEQIVSVVLPSAEVMIVYLILHAEIYLVAWWKCTNISC